MTGTLGLGAAIWVPLGGTVYLRSSDGHMYISITSSDGRFSIRVPIGNYTLTGLSPKYLDGKTDCRSADAIPVQVDAIVTVMVVCEGM